ncbi:MmcQ/YjbR family DNA-binding protein [Phenylobacterium sp.]|uniref:MmcQ/YjbR family DNA-binding protein n=1 Tax=Phenylobacterium sp. TaxID=1871053 RepID=UPI002FDE2264
MTPARAKELALNLEGASARPHFDRTALRTPRKTFATLAGDGTDINLMFDPDLRDFFCEQDPAAFSPVPGGWGRMGATRCDLSAVDEAALVSALKAAHALAAPRPRTPRAR